MADIFDASRLNFTLNNNQNIYYLALAERIFKYLSEYVQFILILSVKMPKNSKYICFDLKIFSQNFFQQ